MSCSVCRWRRGPDGRGAVGAPGGEGGGPPRRGGGGPPRRGRGHRRPRRGRYGLCRITTIILGFYHAFADGIMVEEGEGMFCSIRYSSTTTSPYHA